MRTHRNHWQTVDRTPSLNRSEVHIWRTNLDLPIKIIKELEQTLSTEELDKANRFAFMHDRNRYIASHGILREIIGRYLKIDPVLLEFCDHPLGKPYLSGKFERYGICFNFSHSRNMALYGFAHGREIGVDLEYIDYHADLVRIASQKFSPNEHFYLKSLPEDQLAQAFFVCWTCKEAYLKALGVGLTIPTEQFEISLAPGDSPQLVNMQGDPDEVSRWRLQELTPCPGYAAALAVEGHDWELSRWDYQIKTGLTNIALREM